MATRNAERVLEVFAAAAECPADSRHALLRELCGADSELRSEVESLLAHDDADAPDDFMKPPEGGPLPDGRGSVPHGHPRGSEWALPSRSGFGMGVGDCDESDPRVGQRIGRYTVKSVIATGGMGTVYLAEQDQPHRDVALKVIRPEFASRSGLRRFEIEAEFLAKLRHSNIAHVYEAGVHEEQGPAGTVRLPYFAMEYVEGGQPITVYAGDQGLGRDDRLGLFVQVCNAVHHGHLRGVIHRDLKPANILVDAAGQVKVIDFGVARATDGELSVTTIGTGLNAMIGTPQYMSPEQCKGDPADLDSRTDVYSLGVVLYELLCGRKPYDFGTVYQAVKVICETEPTRPSSVDRALRGDVEAILLAALTKNRDKRYQSAGELAADIRRYLNREPISVRPPTRWTRLVRWAGRHPVAVTGGLAATVGMAVILGAFFASAWLLRNRPHELVVSWADGRKDRAAREVRLLSLGGHLIRTWTPNEGDTINFVHRGLIPRAMELGGGRLMLMGFKKHDDDDLSGALVAFDADGDLATPLWSRRIEPGEPVPQTQTPGIERTNRAEAFIVASGCVADVFAESPGPEIVVSYMHQMFSQSILRIYDLRGELLYEVWHDGSLSDFHWMSDSGLLVVSGANGLYTNGELEMTGFDWIDESADSRHPPVVFAIRPKLGRILHGKYITVTPGSEDWNPKWYLTIEPTPREIWIPEQWQIDAGRTVGLSVDLTDPTYQEDLLLVVNQDGNEVEGSRQRTNNFLANQDKLPDFNDFKLVPFAEVAARKLDSESPAVETP